MFIFKHTNDLSQLPPGNRARFLVEDLLHHLIQNQSGYAVLIEALDVYREEILPELPCPLANVSWEGVTLKGDFYHAVVLTNNDFGIDFLIPDKPWLPGLIRKSLVDHLPP
jgi:hypothetical protein